jgi:hypothetical protein
VEQWKVTFSLEGGREHTVTISHTGPDEVIWDVYSAARNELIEAGMYDPETEDCSIIRMLLE